MQFYCLQSGHYFEEKLHCNHGRRQDVSSSRENDITCGHIIIIRRNPLIQVANRSFAIATSYDKINYSS